MYRPAAFAVDDVTVLHNTLRAHGLVTLAAQTGGAIRFAYAPVVVDGQGPFGSLRFHLAARNPMAALDDGARVWLSLVADDAYVSPDWYRALATVPTWNYVAVEGEGTVRRLSREALRRLLADLSAQEERKLLPKAPWTMDKVAEPRLDAMMNVIVGFSLALERLEGKFKLSQDKTRDDIAGVIAGLEARSDAASLSVAARMRKGL